MRRGATTFLYHQYGTGDSRVPFSTELASDLSISCYDSRQTSIALLSKRSPRDFACLRRFSAVHSTNRIWATISGLVHCISFIRVPVDMSRLRGHADRIPYTAQHRCECAVHRKLGAGRNCDTAGDQTAMGER